MKKILLVLPLIGTLFSSCGVRETLDSLECNKQAVQRSTQVINENVWAIERANQRIEENRQHLEAINKALKEAGEKP